HLPVIGVPVRSSNSIDGWDSVLSILQMPNGIPVATVALNAAKNAGILAAQVIGTFDEQIATNLLTFKKGLKEKVEETATEVENMKFYIEKGTAMHCPTKVPFSILLSISARIRSFSLRFQIY